MAGLSANLDLTGLPEVKALYDAANTAVTLLADVDDREDAQADVVEARRLLVDALIAFREA